MKKPAEYEKSVKKLRDYLYIKEVDRQKWAHENWSHEGGKWFSISRIAIPILSVIGLFMIVVMCIIRFVKMPDIYSQLINQNLKTTEPDNFISVFFVLCFIALYFLVFSNIKIIKNKFKHSCYILAGSSLSLSLISIIRYAIDTNYQVFPDNSNYETFTSITFYEICIATSIIFAVIFILSAIIISVYIKDKIELNRIVERTLINMVPSGSEEGLLNEEKYVDLIEEYIKNDKLRAKRRSSRRSKHNRGRDKYAVFVDESTDDIIAGNIADDDEEDNEQ